MKHTITAFLLSSTLIGCSQSFVTDGPITLSDNDAAACQAIADEVSVTKGTMMGAGLGAGLGAGAALAISLVVPVVAPVAVMALIGGGQGAFSGSKESMKERRHAYIRCLRGRGYPVLS